MHFTSITVNFLLGTHNWSRHHQPVLSYVALPLMLIEIQARTDSKKKKKITKTMDVREQASGRHFHLSFPAFIKIHFHIICYCSYKISN